MQMWLIGPQPWACLDFYGTGGRKLPAASCTRHCPDMHIHLPAALPMLAQSHVRMFLPSNMLLQSTALSARPI